MSEIEIRTCQHCKRSAIVYRDGFYALVKYGIRHYAHPVCLAKKVGTKAARASIPEHQRKSFDVDLLYTNVWDNASIKVKDAQVSRQQAKVQP